MLVTRDIYFIHQPGGPYKKKKCARGLGFWRYSRQRAQFFPIWTDLGSIRSDEGLTLETSALKLLMVANLRYQLS